MNSESEPIGKDQSFSATVFFGTGNRLRNKTHGCSQWKELRSFRRLRMSLSVNGDVLPISHLGPEFIILRNSVEHAPADAEIFLSIDGNESRWMVHLVNGIHPDRLKTAIAPCLNGKI